MFPTPALTRRRILSCLDNLLLVGRIVQVTGVLPAVQSSQQEVDHCLDWVMYQSPVITLVTLPTVPRCQALPPPGHPCQQAAVPLDLFLVCHTVLIGRKPHAFSFSSSSSLSGGIVEEGHLANFKPSPRQQVEDDLSYALLFNNPPPLSCKLAPADAHRGSQEAVGGGALLLLSSFLVNDNTSSDNSGGINGGVVISSPRFYSTYPWQ